MTPIIYIVDDDTAIRHGLSLLMKIAGYNTKSFDCGEDFLIQKTVNNGCILLDVSMGDGMSGLQVQDALIKRHNSLPIIFITALSDAPRIVNATKKGAEDFLIKPVDGELLVARVKQVLDKHVNHLGNERVYAGFMSIMDSLTDREREVMLLSLDGLSCKDVALKLSLSFRTIELYRSHVCTKYRVANMGELSRLTASLGFNLKLDFQPPCTQPNPYADQRL